MQRKRTDALKAKWAKQTKHGEGKTRLYRIWASMKQRCNNPHDHAYQEYGGRGITVCREWEDDYLEFKRWALANGYADDLSIDRIDNDKGYSPQNCRWATREEQQRNRRNNRYVLYNGESMLLAELAEQYGIGIRVLWNRLYKLGWQIEKALTTPVKHYERGN